MTDPRTKKLADILVNYSIEVKPGDWVWLSASYLSKPLAIEVYRAVIQAGGNCTAEFGGAYLSGIEEMNEIFYKEASDEQLNWVSPARELLWGQANAAIFLRGASNTRNLSRIDAKRQSERSAAVSSLRKTYSTRFASGDLRWVLTDFPTPAYAQEANMSLNDFEDFVYAATYADKDDPVAEWQRISNEQQRIVDWLAGKKQITVKSKNADLTMSVEGRTFMNSNGKLNMPDGEVFTSPVEDSVNGWVEFSYPAIRDGREVEGIRLEFKDGKVVKATAEKNEDYLITQLDTDEGARVLGEFAIGTNYNIQQFTKSILYDEKIGGTFHMAVGNGFEQVGSKNISSVHWDMISDAREDSEIAADGEVFYKDGQFQI